MRTDLAAEVAARKRIVSVAEMQALERQADTAGHSYAAMMEIAGRRVAETILARYDRVSCLVLVGPGGEPLNEAVVDRVAEPVEARGSVERHGDLLLLRVAARGGSQAELRPMRLFHYSITYVTLLFLAVAIDPLLSAALA